MKWKIAGVLAVIVFELPAAPADACGIKLVVKTPAARKSIARSSNPSHILLLGSPPHRLERELTAAGHEVEVAPTASAAKRGSYAVVVTDTKQAIEARAKFPASVVVVRSGDVVADIASVEQQVARRRVRADESRQVVAARTPKRPVAAGQGPVRPVVAPVAPASPAAPAFEPPGPAAVAVAAPPSAPEPAATARSPRPSVAAQPGPAQAGDHAELYFGVGSAAIEASHAVLDRTARWLRDSAATHIVIEGHADPTGRSELNRILARRRAEAVRDYLVAAGIDASRMDVISYGDTRQKYGRTDPRNRRVAIEPRR